jgi:hypothetical protein
MAWEWPRESFDCVIGVTLLDHLSVVDGEHIARRMIEATKPGGIVFAEVHTVDDPGSCGIGEGSEFAAAIQHYFDHNELLTWFWPRLRVLVYHERRELDLDHGRAHHHGFATLLARKQH